MQTAANAVSVHHVPPGCTNLRFFLNGVPCHRCPHQASGDTTTVGLTTFDEAVRNAVPSDAPLFQCYAVDKDGRVLATASISELPVPMARNAALTRIPDNARLVASMLHGAGDTHRWQFPVIRHVDDDDTSTTPVLVCLRILFDVNDAQSNSSATGKSIATVEWEATRVRDDRPLGRPPGGAWGQLRGTCTVDASCLESVFCAPASRDGHIRCTITANTAPVATRYAVYGVATPNFRPPLLLPVEVATAGEDRHSGPVSTPLTKGKRLAVLVGVSKYTRRPAKRISDLEYADDDVVLWFQYLAGLGFECKKQGTVSVAHTVP